MDESHAREHAEVDEHRQAPVAHPPADGNGRHDVLRADRPMTATPPRPTDPGR
jgi:hypothetical protein